MFDNTNPYELQKAVRDGETVYIAIFKNGIGQRIESEVSQSVANALFGSFVKRERNLRRSDERHLEQSELSEQTLHERVFDVPKSLEEKIDTAIRNEQLYKAIEKLPVTQRRRLFLYYFKDYTLEQIAKNEGCSVHSAYIAIERAKEKINKFAEQV